MRGRTKMAWVDMEYAGALAACKVVCVILQIWHRRCSHIVDLQNCRTAPVNLTPTTHNTVVWAPA